jgi:hypothetical protein
MHQPLFVGVPKHNECLFVCLCLNCVRVFVCVFVCVFDCVFVCVFVCVGWYRCSTAQSYVSRDPGCDP